MGSSGCSAGQVSQDGSINHEEPRYLGIAWVSTTCCPALFDLPGALVSGRRHTLPFKEAYRIGRAGRLSRVMSEQPEDHTSTGFTFLGLDTDMVGCKG